MIYMPNRQWRFSFTLSSAFRAPNVDDIAKVFESIQGKVIVPNPSLKPEYAYCADFGISRKLTEGVTIQATVYYTLLQNAITLQNGAFNGQDSLVYDGQLSQVMTSSNALKAAVYGFESMLSGKLNDNFILLATINYTKGMNLTEIIPLDHKPPVFGKISLVYSLDKLRSELFVNYSGWKRLEDYNLGGEDNFAYATPYGMPSWYTLNARMNYNLSRKITIQLACENILDMNYRQYASNISAPGRNFILTLRGSF